MSLNGSSRFTQFSLPGGKGTSVTSGNSTSNGHCYPVSTAPSTGISNVSVHWTKHFVPGISYNCSTGVRVTTYRCGLPQ